jgi:hypothetical protein
MIPVSKVAVRVSVACVVDRIYAGLGVCPDADALILRCHHNCRHYGTQFRQVVVPACTHWKAVLEQDLPLHSGQNNRAA